jgi:hypothetical protein
MDLLMTLQSIPARPLLATLILSLASTCVQADWVRITTSQDTKISTYADPDTVRTIGPRVQLMTLTDYQEAQVLEGEKKFKSVKMQDEFNCDDGSGRHLNLSAMSDNMGKGTAVVVEMKPAPLRPIREATADADMLRFACTRK